MAFWGRPAAAVPGPVLRRTAILSLCGLERGEGAEGFPSSLQKSWGSFAKWFCCLPATRDGLTLSAPLARAPILLDSGLAQNLKGCTVLAGMAGGLRKSSPLWETLPVLDYYAREELTWATLFSRQKEPWPWLWSTAPSAGGSAVGGGFGRIGKALCLALRGLGAQVDCAARKPWDLAAIRALGCTPRTYGGLAAPYDVIFNTVPAPVIGEELLSRQGPDTLLLELASAPDGIDRAAAEKRGLFLLDAPSLPGRFSPKASGELIKEAVYHMLQERRDLG